MVQVEEKIYLFGGRNAIDNKFFNDLWEFTFGELNVNKKTNITSITSTPLETSGEVRKTEVI
jgi:hypothetical protein